MVVLDRAPEVEATAAAIRAAGGRAIALIMDSSAEKDVAAAVATAVKEYGGLDVCFANAGISGGLVPFLEETAERFTEILKINLIGTFLLAKYAALEMVKQKHGSIICTASVAGLRSGAGGVPYSASKAGVISLAQTIANQLSGTGVRINAICPGLIETGMTRPIFERARERGSEGKNRAAQSAAALRQPCRDSGDRAVSRLGCLLIRERSSHRRGRGPVLVASGGDFAKVIRTKQSRPVGRD